MFTIILILMILYFIVTFMAGLITIGKFLFKDNDDADEVEKPVKKKKLEE